MSKGGPGGAGPYGPAYVQQQTFNDQASASSCSLTLGGPCLAGDYLFVEYSCKQDQSSAPTISDTAGNSWVAVYTSIGYGIWYCVAKASAAGNVISFGNTSSNQAARVAEVTNFTSAPTITSANATSATATVTGGGLAPSATLNRSTDWAAAIAFFSGATGAEGFALLFFVCGGTSGAAGGSFTLLPSLWIDIFSNDPSFATAFILTYIPAFGVTVDNVVLDIAARAGLESSQVDVSLLTAGNLRPTNVLMGYVIEHPTPAADVLRPLMRAYFFDACESGGKMKFVPRGLASALTIPEEDLGLLKDMAKIEEQIAQEQDLPCQYTATYKDPTLDYQQNKQMKRRSQRIITTRQQAILEMPIVFTPDWAMQTAVKALYLAWLERNSYKMNLWRASYLLLDPTDVIEFIYEALTFQIRVAENTAGQGFSTSIQGLSEFAEIFNSMATGGPALGAPPAGLQVLGPTVLALFDIPLLSDSDSNPDNSGFYFVMSSVVPNWSGGLLYVSTDDSNFVQDASSGSPATFGFATNTLGAPLSPWNWDMTNTLTVKLGRGSFASDTPANVLNGSNALIVGNEIIQFTTANQNPDGTWTLSGLTRGRRGTEWACATHGSGELVVMPSTGIQRVQESLSVVNQQRWFSGVTAGQNISTAVSQEFTDTGNDLRPYAVAGIGGMFDTFQNIIITWVRRTRVGGEADWGDGVPAVPLSEDSELYQVDILNGSTVVRSITGLTTPTAVYTAAWQTADFGSVQSSVTVNVYQISAQVGKGFKASGTVPTPLGSPFIPWPEILPGGSGLYYVNGS